MISPRIRAGRHRPVAHGGRYPVGGDGGTGGPYGPGVIDFSSNITPVGPPQSVRRALTGMPEREIGEYPDPDSAELVGALARYTGLPRSRLVVGNGAVEIIYNFCNAFLRPGRGALVQAPTFGEYEAAARLAGCKIARFNSMDLGLDPDGFASAIPRGGCAFVCNPNNPTGSLLTVRQLSGIVRQARERSSMVFVDESFIELVPGSAGSALGMIGGRHENLVVLRSMTKSFGLAGIRVGYAAALPETASVLRRTKVPWSVSAVAQRAALAALAVSESHLAKSHRIIRRESEFLRRMIGCIPGLECLDSSANFMLVRTRRDSTALQGSLLGRGVLVRDCKDFFGLDGHHIRIAVRGRRDNTKLVEAMEATS